MQIAKQNIETTCRESEIYGALLELDGKHILELGCGDGQRARDIASAGTGRRVTALEVDRIAHEKNVQSNDLPNLSFGLAGAEDIPLDDASVDVVLMFKSLHHVPPEKMGRALRETHRVLKPGGLAYISEPVYAGDFNDILRLFHDEKAVREAAFEAVREAVDSGLFTLAGERFFNAPRKFEDFEAFEQRIIGATHADHRLDADTYARVKRRFERHMGDDGARFLNPVRVDLLRKP